MIDFLIKAWFEKKEKQTKSAFFELKTNQFKDRVSDIQTFCNRCWNSEEWKDLKKDYNYWTESADPHYSSYVCQELKEKYERFVERCNAKMELLIQLYNDFYDDIWKNTDLDISAISIYGNQHPISYDLHHNYDGKLVPDFNHYARGWTREWHEAYCTMANLMLLIRKCCDIICYIRKDPVYNDLYPRYSYYSIMREDKPNKKDDSQEIYEQAKKALEAEMNVENNTNAAEAETNRMKMLFAGYYKQSDPDECCSGYYKQSDPDECCSSKCMHAEETSDLLRISDLAK